MQVVKMLRRSKRRAVVEAREIREKKIEAEKQIDAKKQQKRKLTSCFSDGNRFRQSIQKINNNHDLVIFEDYTVIPKICEKPKTIKKIIEITKTQTQQKYEITIVAKRALQPEIGEIAYGHFQCAKWVFCKTIRA